jgi:hypothetical protein
VGTIRGVRGRRRRRKEKLKVIKRRWRWVKRTRSAYVASPRLYQLFPNPTAE